ncbi:MAG: response regulator [Desulfobacterium sp.]|nr:response regulator [Desulfobacterium sp.]
MRNRILIVDDLPANIKVLSELLRADYQVSATTNGGEALEIARSAQPPDLILLDVMIPEMDGYEVCRQLKKDPRTSRIPVLFVTAMDEVKDETFGLSLGAVDYITKPVSTPIVLARVKTHINLRHHESYLEQLVTQRTQQLRNGYIDTIHRLTLASEYKDEETGAHIRRISYYTRAIALEMGLDKKFAETIFYASPMHDIGKVGIPDAILLKEGPLDEEEWRIMKTHPEIGADILEGSDSPFLVMAVDIARCHHERWDGKGYPKGLKGDEIPLTARIMNLSDQYDALRSKRPYKPAFDHKKSVDIIIKGDGRTMPSHFDPEVLHAFKGIKSQFNEIFEGNKD